MTRSSVSDPLAAFLEHHGENVHVNVMVERGGFVANVFLMDWTRRGREVREFFYWSSAHTEVPQPTIEAAIEQLRVDVSEVGDQFFLREVAQVLVNLNSLPQDQQPHGEEAIGQLAELVEHSRVSAQPTWMQQVRVWCGDRIENDVFTSYMDAVGNQLAQRIESSIDKRPF
ncbi:hypothetical protein [Deinococcus irradiatisoli]|uniref:hypothetical protein n=1 Tax=Deinococcus irradiatisoli TaxID=2202254 RepID=UPI0011B1ED20|nr:hypothetical protein [Deinococcus irradiatisoli]